LCQQLPPVPPDDRLHPIHVDILLLGQLSEESLDLVSDVIQVSVRHIRDAARQFGRGSAVFGGEVDRCAVRGRDFNELLGERSDLRVREVSGEDIKGLSKLLVSKQTPFWLRE
jgi:hypothetical protein